MNRLSSDHEYAIRFWLITGLVIFTAAATLLFIAGQLPGAIATTVFVIVALTLIFSHKS